MWFSLCNAIFCFNLFFDQRLSSSGYVFSASLPPYLASAAITAIDILEENPALIRKLKSNVAMLWRGLIKFMTNGGFSFSSSYLNHRGIYQYNNKSLG